MPSITKAWTDAQELKAFEFMQKLKGNQSLSGFRYSIYAVASCLNDETRLKKMLHQGGVYETVGTALGKSPIFIERNIRHYLRDVFSAVNIAENKEFLMKTLHIEAAVKNKDFLTHTVAYLQKKQTAKPTASGKAIATQEEIIESLFRNLMSAEKDSKETKGIQYLHEIAYIGMENPDALTDMFSKTGVYSLLAEKHETASANVERNIRSFLQLQMTDRQNAYLKRTCGIQKACTNKEAIHRIVNYIYLRMLKESLQG